MTELNKLIEKIVYYYELTYPDSLLETNKIDSSKSNLTKSDFEYTLSLNNWSKQILNPRYDSNCHYYYQEDNIWKEKCLITIPIKNNPFVSLNIFFNQSGKVNKYDISGHNGPLKNVNKNTTLNSLYEEIKKYPEIFDYLELEEIITNYQREDDLRKKVIVQAILRLISNKNSTKNKGLLRAKQLIKDFNKYYKLNMDIKALKPLIASEQKEQNKLPTLYNNYLINYQLTGKRPYPDKLLALLLLEEKANYEPIVGSVGEFYRHYQEQIDIKINKVINDFELTKEDIIHYIEEKGILYREETYERDKIWFVFVKGFEFVNWSNLYHPSYTPEQVYQKCLHLFHDEPYRNERPKTRNRTLERVRKQQRSKKNGR